MKIINCKTTIVTVPLARPWRWRMAECKGFTSVIVELRTDEGLCGIGESPCFFPPAEATRGIIETSLPFVIGEDPFDHERIYRRILARNGLYYDRVLAGLALSGIDLALWDLMGKSAGQPLYKLIGGRCHSDAGFVCILNTDSPSAMAAEAVRAVTDGCRTLYLKFDDDEAELYTRLEAIRRAVGARPKLRIDFNQALTPGFAVKFIRELEHFDLESVEQPCGEEDLEGLAHIRKSISTPLISDESSKTFYHAFNTIRAGAADIIEVDPYTSDGIWGARKICGMAEAAGLPVVFHALGELGLNQMKTVHLGVSTPNATLDHQTLYQYLADDIIAGGLLSVRGWQMDAPDKPGLGVELDSEKLDRYATLYAEEGGNYIGSGGPAGANDYASVRPISSRAAKSLSRKLN